MNVTMQAISVLTHKQIELLVELNWNKNSQICIFVGNVFSCYLTSFIF